MVKIRNINAKPKRKGAKKVKLVRKVPKVTRPIVDQAAKAHIRLMLDPCQAPLVRPAYETSAGGLLVRYRKVMNVANTAGDTAFVAAFLPHENMVHYLNTGNPGTPNTLIASEVFTGLDQVAGGSTFSFRCVAGCLKAIPLMSELNRQGVVSAGSVDSDVVIPTDPAQTTTITGIQAVLPITTRTPNSSIEVLWTPGENSHQYRASDVSPSILVGTHNNACVLAASGLPAAAGFRLEFTGVYEVRPANSSNVVAVVEPPPSSSTWNQVLREFMAAAGDRVMVEGARVATAGASYLGQQVAMRLNRLEL